MIGLYEHRFGALPLADIKSLRHVDATPNRIEHHVLQRHSTESTIELHQHDVADLLQRPVQLVPVEPGTKLVRVFVGSAYAPGPSFADVTPIHAWALCLDGQVRPVTHAGVRCGYSPYKNYAFDWHPDYVLNPDGSYHEYGLEAEPERYTSIDEVIAAEEARQRRYDQDRAEHAAGPAAAAEAAA